MAMVLEMWLDRSIFNLPYDLGLSCYIKHINDGEHMSARHVALDLQKTIPKSRLGMTFVEGETQNGLYIL
jgi:hypothetical protein